MTATGWAFEKVGRMPWPRVCSLYKYWKEYPPVHVLLANMFYSRASKTKLTEVEQQFMSDLPVKPLSKAPVHILQFVKEMQSKKVVNT